jgi:hypothetical protein
MGDLVVFTSSTVANSQLMKVLFTSSKLDKSPFRHKEQLHPDKMFMNYGILSEKACNDCLLHAFPGIRQGVQAMTINDGCRVSGTILSTLVYCVLSTPKNRDLDGVSSTALPESIMLETAQTRPARPYRANLQTFDKGDSCSACSDPIAMSRETN